MGKNWKRQPHQGGGGGGSSNDTNSCRGYAAIIGTCDAARERETSKEMVNLLNQAIETIDGDTQGSDCLDFSSVPESVDDMLALEIAKVKKQNHTATQNVMSINTKVKGLVLIKILRRDLCPIVLLKSIFERVRKDKMPCSRHVVRLIPLQKVCYPSDDDVVENMIQILGKTFPGAKLPNVEELKSTNSQSLTSKLESNESVGEIASVQIESINTTNSEVESHTQVIITSTNDCVTSDLLSNQELGKRLLSETDFGDSTNSIKEGIENNILNPSVTSKEIEPSKRQKLDDEKDTIIVMESTNDIVVLETQTETFYPPIFYTVSFKARNHNVLNKDTIWKTVAKLVPKFMKLASWKTDKTSQVRYFTPIYFVLIFID